MKDKAYFARYGCERLSWSRFGELTAVLSEQLAAAGVEMVVGVGRAGLLPATAVAGALQLALWPISFQRGRPPIWHIDAPTAVAGKRVALVDEVADSGGTLRLVSERLRARGALTVTTAVLVAHSWAAPRPHCVAWETDAFVIFPWEERAYVNGRWQIHPEVADCHERR